MSALARMLDDAAGGNAFRSTFELMEVAGREVTAALATRRARKSVAVYRRIDDAWMALGDGLEAFHGKAPEVFRHHCRELLERAAAGEPLQPGTEAEVLLALSALSLKAPPSSQYAALFERLFVAVMGRRVEGEPTREPWPGAADELLRDMRRKLRREGRK